MELKLNELAVGFDFSVGAEAALRAAIRLAQRVDARINVITAVPGAIDTVVLDYLRSKPTEGEAIEVEAKFLERVERIVRYEVADHYDTVDVDVRYDVGQLPATKMILSAAKTADADMIILGAVGNRPPKSTSTVGHDVERVVRHSQVPVLVVRPGRAFPPERLLCAVDFSEASERALGWAIDWARMFGTSVDVLHVLPRASANLNEAFDRIYPAGYDEAERDLGKRSMDDLLGRFDTDGIRLSVLLEPGVPHQVIEERLKDGGYDLLTIGTLGRNPLLELLLGGTAERVIRSSPCSVLAVKPDTFALRRDAGSRTTNILGSTAILR